jgi:tubulin polyglutamylase TTLL1
MVKNIKRWKKDFERDSSMGFSGKTTIEHELIPHTYILPQDYSIFMDEFQKNPNKKWIVKPAARSQGKGIFIMTKYSQSKQLSAVLFKQDVLNKENFVVSKYIDNPMLIGGKKFDLRLYVLVTNYKPLKVWKSSKAFARFCSENYCKDDCDEESLFSHLTNVSYQIKSDKYNNVHGGKWSYSNFLLFIEINYGRKKFQKMVEEIDYLIISSLKSVQSVIFNDKHCFEMYGYDVLIDANLKPWLIEINASPSLSDTTVEDKAMKKALINDVFNIVMPGDWLKTRANVGTDTCKEAKVGSFEVLFDEANNKFKAQPTVKRPASASGMSRLAQSTVNKFAKKPLPFFR